MTDGLLFKDVEAGLLDGLKAHFPQLADPVGRLDYHVGTEPPKAGSRPSVAERGLFVWLDFSTGSDDFFTDYPTVWVNVLGASRQAVYDLSEAIRSWLLAAPLVVGGVAIDTVTTRTRPVSLPWEGDGIRRRGASYELSVRRR